MTRSGQSWMGAGPPALRSPEGLCCPTGAGWGRPPVGLSTFSWLAGPDGHMLSRRCPCMLAARTHAGGGGFSYCTQLGSRPWPVCPVSTKVQSGVVLRPPAVLHLSTGSGQRPGRLGVLFCGVPPSPEQQLCGPWETLPGSGGCSVWKVARWQRQPGVLSV